MSDESFIPGDRVEFIGNDGTGCTGTKKGAVYTVVRWDSRCGYLYVKELEGRGIYDTRFKLLPRYDKSIVIACLIELRDSTNSQGTHARCVKALEEMGKVQ